MRTHDNVLDTIRIHGSESYPEEGCGFLLGRLEESGNYVAAAVPVKNRRKKNRERRFTISAADFHQADRAARNQGWDIVGFYHSHPNHPARPSATDLAEATFPGYTYIIVSVHNRSPTKITAWSLWPDRSRFESEPIEIISEINAAPK